MTDKLKSADAVQVLTNAQKIVQEQLDAAKAAQNLAELTTRKAQRDKEIADTIALNASRDASVKEAATKALDAVFGLGKTIHAAAVAATVRGIDNTVDAHAKAVDLAATGMMKVDSAAGEVKR